MSVLFFRILIQQQRWRSTTRTLRANLLSLIVDDCSASLKIHAALVKMLGFNPIGVKNGEAAVDLYCLGAHYDLVLMDLYIHACREWTQGAFTELKYY